MDGVPVRLRTLAPAGRRRDALTPTVLLVHGIGMSSRSFDRSQQTLSRTHRTVAVDLPGFGGVPAVGRRLEVAELADLVVRAVRRCGIRQSVVVGQSMGTQVAVEAALRHPDDVDAVVLVGPVVDPRRRSVPRLAVDLVRDSFVEGVRMNAVVATDHLRSLRQYRHQLRPMLRYPMLESVSRLDVPVLVVRGAEDPITRHAWAARVAGMSVRGVLVELRGPHHVQEHQPVAFADLVSEFRRVQTLEGLR
ncbi:alpha-beta hydrolase superfamily lysophospholipase [Curtobacterium sp. PhB130]|nr:alpha-beta hydrolase superfamily lysophospholipase [Curtobacterium sp. ZW137]ROS75788.1 alpha-beta hydrolase superfamily lysophospholipase [Curtobacterium sp. PhB130]TCK64478.1 alpha-beta hydrolase superfamily lysophospholipase [Curtobacterium sp. PhB136]